MESQYISFGVMGGPMQPQGHVQVLSNIIDFGMNMQEAGDAARIRHSGSVLVEPGVSDEVIHRAGAAGARRAPCREVDRWAGIRRSGSTPTRACSMGAPTRAKTARQSVIEG